jgi:glycosyltransferase involved in cell wall biosynthesis
MVSVIVPVYNRLEKLKNTIFSIVNQTYKDFELIIVDDFSEQITKEEFKSLEVIDHRIKVVQNINTKGAPGARNTGLEYARGSKILFFDSDNIMKPKLLETCCNYLDENTEKDAVSCFSLVLDDNSKVIDAFTWKTEGDIFTGLLTGSTYADTSSVMYRKNALIGVYWDELLCAYQEWDFNLAVSSNGMNYGQIFDFLVDYYRWSQETISSNKVKDNLGRVYIYLKWKNHFKKAIGNQAYYRFFISIQDWRTSVKKVNEIENLKYYFTTKDLVNVSMVNFILRIKSFRLWKKLKKYS